MKIKNLLFMLFFIFTVTFISCANDPTNGKSPEPSDMTDAIIEAGDFEELIDIQSDRLELFYSIDESALESYSVRVCLTGGNADEVVIMKANSPDNVEVIKKAVEKRKSARMSVFKDYRPNEYKKLENSIVKSTGTYVLFVVSGNTNEAVKIFNGFFKK